MKWHDVVLVGSRGYGTHLNSSDADMASSSCIISPTGEVTMNDALEAVEGSIDFREIKKMRRYIVMD